MLRPFFFSILLCLFLAMFESAVLTNIQVLFVIPDLLLITVIYLSYKNGSFFGETCGFFSGIIIDVLSASPIGLNACIRAITGFVFGSLKASFFIDKLLFPFIFCFVGTFSKVLIAFVLSLFYRDGIRVQSLFDSLLWIEAVVNGLLAPVLFAIYNSFSGILHCNARSSNDQ